MVRLIVQWVMLMCDVPIRLHRIGPEENDTMTLFSSSAVLHCPVAGGDNPSLMAEMSFWSAILPQGRSW